MVVEFDNNCLLRPNSVVCCMIKGVPVESNPLQTYTLFPLIEAGSQIQAGSLIEAGVNNKYHRANGIGHRTVVRCVIHDVLRYILVLNYGIRCSKRRKSHTLKLKLEAGEPNDSNRSQVSNTSRVSNRSRGSDGIVLIQAGGFC